MVPSLCTALERTFYEHLHGEYESFRRWAWLYLHVGVLLLTALVGYAAASGRHALAAGLLVFPAYYLYRRYDHARPAGSAD